MEDVVMRDVRRDIRRRAAVLAAVLVATLVALSGCAAKRGHDLNFAGGVGTECTPARTGSVMFAFDSITNLDSNTIVLDKVRLVRPRHVTLVGAFVAPIGGSGLMGIFPGWPPPDMANPEAFDLRQPFHGYQLPPKGAPDHQVLLHLNVSKLNAGFAAYRLYYRTSSGSERYMQTAFKIRLHDGSCL